MKIIPINKFATGNYIKIQNKIFKSFHSNPIHTLSKSNTKFIELFNFLNKSNSKTGVMPLVSIPIVAYMATTKKIKEEREYNKNEEASKRLKPNDTEWNEKKSRKILAEHNITNKQEQDKYIGTDGKLNSDSNKKTPFKASTDDQHFDVEAQDNLVLSKDEMKILHEMNSIDIQMDPVLQEIHDAPPLDTVEGLMTSIFGEIPAGVNFDWDLWSALKGIANDIIDIGDWI